MCFICDICLQFMLQCDLTYDLADYFFEYKMLLVYYVMQHIKIINSDVQIEESTVVLSFFQL